MSTHSSAKPPRSVRPRPAIRAIPALLALGVTLLLTATVAPAAIAGASTDGQVPTTTTLTASPNPGSVGDVATFTATVSATAGTVTPTGTVTFSKDHGTYVFRTVTINPDAGTAILAIPVDVPDVLSVRETSDITATYNGSADFAASASAPLTYTVSEVPVAPTPVSVDAFPNPATVGDKIDLVAAIGPALWLPTGEVTFFDGNTVLGTNTIGADNGGSDVGQAILTVTLPAGTHHITASWDYSTARSDVLTLVVKPKATSTTKSSASVTGHGGSSTTAARGTTGNAPSTHQRRGSTETGAGLADTGAPVGAWAAAGLVALALGAIALLLVRRRDRSTRSS